MNVLQLLTQTNPDDVVEAHNHAYSNYPISRNSYDDFLKVIRHKVLIQQGMFVDIDHHETRHDDPRDDESHFDVLIFTDQTYSMSFVPWGEILAGEVRDNTHLDLTFAQQAAHIFWEMTWYGMEEETQEKGDELNDVVESLHRSIDQHEANIASGDAEQGSLPPVSDFLLEPEKNRTPEEKRDLERYRANRKTARHYRNGKLRDDL